MNLVDEISEAWGWVGIEPIEVIGENDFGNLIIKDTEGKYWRLCPEDGYCSVIASNRTELDALLNNQEFLHDWYMKELIEQALETYGPLTEGRKFCLKVPGYLGGEYGGDNIGTISLLELVGFSGYLAKETADLPDGAQIKLKIAD